MFDPNTIILIVDDMKTMRMKVTKACESLGFKKTLQADNGRTAWEVLQDAKPPVGLVLSDWNMPDSDGLDLLKRVRADQRLKKLPFILVSAESEKAQIQQAVSLGVSNYILKPFTPEMLREKLEATYKAVHQE